MAIPTHYSKQGKLFFTPIESGFGGFLHKACDFWKNHPQIREAVASDLMTDGLKRKHQRNVLKHDSAEANLRFPEILGDEHSDLSACSVRLLDGRPRMSPKLAFLFMMIRGWLGSICAAEARDFMLESQTLASILEKEGVALPGVTTIVENVNCLSTTTREEIFKAQLRCVGQSQLDDFDSLTIDSTAVEASSSWPTDSKLITRLLQRMIERGSKLPARLKFSGLDCKCTQRWIKELVKLDFKINTCRGESSIRHRRTLYQDFYLTAIKVLEKVYPRIVLLMDTVNGKRLSVVQKKRCDSILENVLNDLDSSYQTLLHSIDRIEHGRMPKIKERFLSLADTSATIIVKGERIPILGYKPQLVRSRQGFVTTLLLQQGNVSDSSSLIPAVESSIANTGVTPTDMTGDDGYTSAAGLRALEQMGIKNIAFSGAKGKKLLGEEIWNDPQNIRQRNDRSAVESLMFMLKHCFDFARMRRRGIQEVREEMLEKIIAYNFGREIFLSREKKMVFARAA